MSDFKQKNKEIIKIKFVNRYVMGTMTSKNSFVVVLATEESFMDNIYTIEETWFSLFILWF